MKPTNAKHVWKGRAVWESLLESASERTLEKIIFKITYVILESVCFWFLKYRLWITPVEMYIENLDRTIQLNVCIYLFREQRLRKTRQIRTQHFPTVVKISSIYFNANKSKTYLNNHTVNIFDIVMYTHNKLCERVSVRMFCARGALRNLFTDEILQVRNHSDQNTYLVSAKNPPAASNIRPVLLLASEDKYHTSGATYSGRMASTSAFGMMDSVIRDPEVGISVFTRMFRFFPCKNKTLLLGGRSWRKLYVTFMNVRERVLAERSTVQLLDMCVSCLAHSCD